LLVGYTYYDADDVDLILDEFGKFWQGCLYDPFRHNCNDFSKAVIQHLCHEEGMYEFPEYVNRFSKFSSVLRVWFQPLKNLFGDIVNAPDGDAEVEGEGEGDIEEGKYADYAEEQKAEKDEHFDKIIIEAKKDAENSNSYYITGFYENAMNTNLLVLRRIKFYANNISEIKDLRLATLFNLAMCCQKLNQIKDMVDYCTMCIRTDPNNPKYFLKRGLAYAYHQKDYNLALVDLEKARSLDPNDPVIIDELKKVKEKIEIDHLEQQ
jgi:tetratricopeptide (TPR) repeat protein